MIAFTILSAFVYLKSDKKLFIIGAICSLVFLAIFLCEVLLTEVNYLASDEYRYYHLSEEYIKEGNDRTLWLYVNKILKNFDLFGEFFIKLINIPLAIYFINLINNVFDIKNRLSVFLLVPFIIVLSVSNLRDVLIWIATVHFCLSLYSLKERVNLFSMMFWAVVLFSLRPIILFTVILLYFIVNFSNFRKSRSKSIFSVILVSGILSSLVLFFSSYLNRVIYNGGYYLRVGLAHKAELTGFSQYFYPDNMPLTFSYASIRYIFTPLPTSIIERLFSGHFYKHGVISELVRLLHQFVYFYLLLFIFANFRKVLGMFWRLNSLHRFILLNLLAYMPVYTVYAFGGVHQRNKFPFQLALVIIYVLYKQKKKDFVTR